jgi:hypothetical protein
MIPPGDVFSRSLRRIRKIRKAPENPQTSANSLRACGAKPVAIAYPMAR